MKLLETKHHAANGARIYTGLLRVSKWDGIVIVNGYNIEVYLTMSAKCKKHYASFKAVKEFDSYRQAKEFATTMQSSFTSLKSLRALGFQRFD